MSEPQRAGSPAPAPDLPRTTLFGQTFHRLSLEEAAAAVEGFVDARAARVVAAKNVAVLLECDQEPGIRAFYERCDLVSVDGRPLVYLSRLTLEPLPEMVGGPRLWWRVVETAARRGFSLFLVGGEPGVADAAAAELRQRFPGLRILGTRDGRGGVADGGQAAARAVAETAPDLVLVALPHGLREDFADRLLAGGYAGVCVLVGGMFDVFAGRRQVAHALVSRLCLEWAYRAAQEPRRLGPRYLREGAAFVWLLLRRVGARLSGSTSGQGGPQVADTPGRPRPEEPRHRSQREVARVDATDAPAGTRPRRRDPTVP